MFVEKWHLDNLPEIRGWMLKKPNSVITEPLSSHLSGKFDLVASAGYCRKRCRRSELSLKKTNMPLLSAEYIRKTVSIIHSDDSRTAMCRR